MTNYISVKDAANIQGLTARRVQYLCKGGRIPGVRIISGVWLIPDDAEKPGDKRFKK